MSVPCKQKRKLVILGCGVWAFNQLEYFQNEQKDAFEFCGFCQNDHLKAEDEFLEGYPILSLEELPSLAETSVAFSGLGQPAAKDRFAVQAETMGFEFATFISRHAHLQPSVIVEPGCAISQGAVVASKVRFGRHANLTGNAVVGEGAQIGRSSHIAPCAVIGGRTRLGERCFVGMGAMIIENLTIGRDVTVGAGSVVIRDVPDGATVVGNPARIVKIAGSSAGK